MSKANKENNTSGHIQLDLTYDEVNLLRECMKRTEDYYRGLILLKSEWHPEQNKDVLSYMKAKVRLIDNLQEKHCTTDNQNTIGRCNELMVGRVYWYNIAYTKNRKMQGKKHHENRLKIITINNGSTPISVKCC